jgi:hypothetical protein
MGKDRSKAGNKVKRSEVKAILSSLGEWCPIRHATVDLALVVRPVAHPVHHLCGDRRHEHNDKKMMSSKLATK